MFSFRKSTQNRCLPSFYQDDRPVLPTTSDKYLEFNGPLHDSQSARLFFNGVKGEAKEVVLGYSDDRVGTVDKFVLKSRISSTRKISYRRKDMTLRPRTRCKTPD